MRPAPQQPAFADANWRALDLPHDWSDRGAVRPERALGRRRRIRAHRHRLVPQALPRPGRLQGPQGLDRIRRRLPEQRSLDQRSLPRQAPLRLHQLRLRPHAASERRGRQRDRREGGQFPPAVVAVVLGVGHLSPHLAGRRESRSRGALGDVRHHAAGLEGCRRRPGEDAGPQRSERARRVHPGQHA